MLGICFSARGCPTIAAEENGEEERGHKSSELGVSLQVLVGEGV